MPGCSARAAACKAGTAKPCTDANVCTDDSCDKTTDNCNPKTGCAAAFAPGSSCLGTDNKVPMCDVTTFKTVCVGCAKVP
ncbi:MAG: hypothetical protein HY902_12950 [Deltaproteobacteria bacterium]|nr:hypothetical protein [Deltaproteobacteria bacterium]